jgi:hypothetical protein
MFTLQGTDLQKDGLAQKNGMLACQVCIYLFCHLFCKCRAEDGHCRDGWRAVTYSRLSFVFFFFFLIFFAIIKFSLQIFSIFYLLETLHRNSIKIYIFLGQLAGCWNIYFPMQSFLGICGFSFSVSKLRIGCHRSMNGSFYFGGFSLSFNVLWLVDGAQGCKLATREHARAWLRLVQLKINSFIKWTKNSSSVRLV